MEKVWKQWIYLQILYLLYKPDNVDPLKIKITQRWNIGFFLMDREETKNS